MFLLNSRLGLFTATPSGSRRSSFTLLGHPFSRGYGAILPSSLARVLSRALGSSPRLPVSVSGTVTYTLLRGFSRQCGFSSFGLTPSPSPLRIHARRISLSDSLLAWTCSTIRTLYLSSCFSPSVFIGYSWSRNINLLSIAYGSLHRLRSA